MALTDAQIEVVFEILDIPHDDSIIKPDGNTNLLGVEYDASSSTSLMQTLLTTKINALSTSKIDKLTTLINRWETLGTMSFAIDGGTGGVNGVMIDPSNERTLIAQRVSRLVSFAQIVSEVNSAGMKNTSRIINLYN